LILARTEQRQLPWERDRDQLPSRIRLPIRFVERWRFVPLASMRACTIAHSSTALATRGAPHG
jgi:hypothetical protein